MTIQEVDFEPLVVPRQELTSAFRRAYAAFNVRVRDLDKGAKMQRDMLAREYLAELRVIAGEWE